MRFPWLNRRSWRFGATAGFVIALAVSTLAAAVQPEIGFTCKPNGDRTLECEATGLSDAKRAPEWTVSIDGDRVDRARGWRAVLYPRAGEVNTITLRAFYHDQEVMLASTWVEPAAEAPASERQVARQE